MLLSRSSVTWREPFQPHVMFSEHNIFSPWKLLSFSIFPFAINLSYSHCYQYSYECTTTLSYKVKSKSQPCKFNERILAFQNFQTRQNRRKIDQKYNSRIVQCLKKLFDLWHLFTGHKYSSPGCSYSLVNMNMLNAEPVIAHQSIFRGFVRTN